MESMELCGFIYLVYSKCFSSSAHLFIRYMPRRSVFSF